MCWSCRLAPASELEMRPVVARCHLGLGRLSRRTGKREPAQEHLTTATVMYGETGMTRFTEASGLRDTRSPLGVSGQNGSGALRLPERRLSSAPPR